MSTPALSTSSIAQLQRRRYGPSEMDLRAWAARDAAPMTFVCLWCGWGKVGTAAEMRQIALNHRVAEHGWKPKRRRKR